LSDYPIEGHCDKKFFPVRDAFIQNYHDGKELGSAFTLMVGDEVVVDLWGGFSKVDRSAIWEKNTLVSVSSSSKTIINLCGYLAVDRGLIDLDKPIATYWPEFAAEGKDKILVRNIFSHTTGFSHIDGKPGWDVFDNWSEMTKRIAAQKPWWEPGSQSGYQPFIYGHLIGELIRRTTGRTLGQFFKEEIQGPLEIDFSFGHESLNPKRISQIDRSDANTHDIEADSDKESIGYLSIGYTFVEDGNFAYLLSKGGITGIDIPASNGVTNARALAKACSVLAQGGIFEGKRYIRETIVAQAYEEHSYTDDLVIEAPVRLGLGFGINSKEISLPWPNAFHWGGYGGSSTIMVPELRAAFAFTPNKFSGERGTIDDRGGALLNAIAECFGY
jgi:CubicO group peptidase (beta-lactamase class C family)